MEFFLETKCFRQCFELRHSLAYQSFCTRLVRSTRSFQKHQRFIEFQKWPTYYFIGTVRPKVSEHFLVKPSNILPKLLQKTDDRFDLLSASFTLPPLSFQNENSQFNSLVIFIFQKLRKLCKHLVAVFLASCKIHICSVTTDRWPQLRQHQKTSTS